MAFRTEFATTALVQINLQALVIFEEMTREIDLFETAIAAYDGVILQLLFPNQEAGYPKFQLLKTDIGLAETTVYLKNGKGETDLTLKQVVQAVNVYVQASIDARNRKWDYLDKKGGFSEN